MGRQEENIYLTLYPTLGTNLSFGFIHEMHSSFKFVESSGVDLVGFCMTSTHSPFLMAPGVPAVLDQGRGWGCVTAVTTFLLEG